MTLLPPSAFVVPSDESDDSDITDVSDDYIITDSLDTVLVDVRGHRGLLPSATTHTQTVNREATDRASQGNLTAEQAEGYTQVTPRWHTDRETQGCSVALNDTFQQTEPTPKVVSTATSPVHYRVEGYSQITQTEARSATNQKLQAAVEMVNVADQTDDTDEIRDVILVLQEFSSNPSKYDFSSLNYGYSGLVPHLAHLRTQLKASDDKIKLMEDAIKRTVPDNLELQESYSKLQTTNTDLEATITELKETTELLEKRLASQLKVMDIQDEGLTKGNATYLNVLRGWRRKVMEMLVEKELNTMCEDRQNLQLLSQNNQLNNELRGKISECELLLAKQQDMKANLQLKDKVISNMTNEISALSWDKNYQHKMRSTLEELVRNLTDAVTESERKIISPTLSVINNILEYYDEQITRISTQLQRLKILYNEKENFFSEKLENLLTKHTAPKMISHSPTQTTLSWSTVESEYQHLKTRIVELEHKLNNAVVEKGLLSSQLGENNQQVVHLQAEVRALQERLASMASTHEMQLSEQHKRECKAAIHAKHLERRLQAREKDNQQEKTQLESIFKEQMESLKCELVKLKSENVSLRKALKQA